MISLIFRAGLSLPQLLSALLLSVTPNPVPMKVRRPTASTSRYSRSKPCGFTAST